MPKNINAVNDLDLPPYCEPSKELSSDCYYEGLNIFTEFGDLSPSQALTIFNQFVRWPEYKDCPFIHSMENNFIKMDIIPEETQVEEELDLIDEQSKDLEDD